MRSFSIRRLRSLSAIFSATILFATIGPAFGQAIPQKNVNAIGPTPAGLWYAGDTFMQFNEADGACSPNNPLWCAIGMNDYRGVNNALLGDAFQGIAMTRDGGRTWISGLHPGHLLDTINIDKQFAADPNLEAVPGMLFFNYIAGWRDGSKPGGVFVGRWYERNREVGPPWQHLDNRQAADGSSGRFLDKPAFKIAYKHPSEPGIVVDVPALDNPDPAAPEGENLHDAYALTLPAMRMHLCFAVFVGNDNNDGTKIECQYSDDAGESWSNKTKLSESTEINQGVSLATRNYGQEILATWLRFRDNNEDDTIMIAYSSDGGGSWSNPTELTKFCPFNQPTGPARHRTNALPVAVSNGDEFAVYFTSRNRPTPNGDNTCVIPAKGSKEAIEQFSNVAKIDDFDTVGEISSEPDYEGPRVRDGRVRMSRNFARIMMMRSSNPTSLNSWSNAIEVDPQLRSDVEECQGTQQGKPIECRRNHHQYMPATAVAGGIETVAWYDSRLDRLNNLANPVTSGFVGDVIVNLKSETCDPETGLCTPPWTKATLLPAELYELEPPPPEVPAPGNNIALRRNIDVFAAQIENGIARTYTVDPTSYYPSALGGEPSPSVRVTRFTTQVKRDASGSIVTKTVVNPNDPSDVREVPVREQVQFNFPNARMFQKGTRPFIGDYNTVFAVNARLENGEWVSNQSAIDTSAFNPESPLYFSSIEPMFHIGWTSNRDVRGKVFYTGCDEWNEAEQRWQASDSVECNSGYVTPDAPPAAMMPLQGADGTPATAPGVCSIEVGNRQNLLNSYSGPLTRNQKIYTSVLKPGLNAEVLSAIKERVGPGSEVVPLNTFVIAVQNGTAFAKRVRLQVASGEIGVSFERKSFVPDPMSPPENPVGYVDVVIPAGSSNIRTLFDAAGDLLDDEITVEVYDVSDQGIFDEDGMPLPDSVPPSGTLVSRIPLERDSATPLEPLSTLDPNNLPIDVTQEDFFRVLLTRETAATKTLEFQNLEFQNLEFQNLEFQNQVKLLEFENSAELLEFQNLEFENSFLFLEFQNLEFENVLVDNSNLTDSSYSVDDFFAQLEFENSVELLEFQNLEFQNLEFQNRTLAEDLEFLEFENTFLEALEFQNENFEFLEFENLEFQNLEFQNLEFQNANTENLEFQNTPFFASSVDNPDLGNLTLDDSLIGTKSVEVSWKAESDSNTTTGVDIKPIFSPALVTALEGSGAKVILSIREVYFRPTVSLTADTNSFCTVQVIAQNQVVYSAVLTPSQINNLFNDPDADDAFAPAVVLDPTTTKIITLQLVNPPAAFDSVPELSAAAGMAIFAQGAANEVCVEQDEANQDTYDVCEIDQPVADETAPVITLNGDDPYYVEAGLETYMEPGATAVDDFDGAIAVGPADISGTVDYSVLNTPNLITYTVADSAGNIATATRSVIVEDNTKPLITLNGDANPVLEAAVDGYTEEGASVSDNFDTTVPIVIGGDTVNTDLPDVYVLTYDATDGEGNVATRVTRTVTVQDTTSPVIDTASLPTDDDPVLPGIQIVLDANTSTGFDPSIQPPPYSGLIWNSVTATDLVDGQIVAECTPAAGDAFVLGSTGVTCTADDASPDAGAVTASFEVVVRDLSGPVIDGLNPPVFDPLEPFVLTDVTDSTFTLVWGPVTASDTVIPNIEVTCSPGTLVEGGDPGTFTFTHDFPVGTTTVICMASDGANVTTVSFPVLVTDEAGPQITLAGEPVITLEVGVDSYVEAGATAFDFGDNASVEVTIGGDEVDAGTIGTYVVSYTATDSTGNPSVETRTVNVVDTAGPTFTLIENPLVISTATASAIVDVLGNVSVTDTVDGALAPACNISIEGGEPTPVVEPVELQLNDTAIVSCTATDGSGNESSIEFPVSVEYLYAITIVPLKGNVLAGSTAPIDWYYSNKTTEARVDTSTVNPQVAWFGPYTDRECDVRQSGIPGDGMALADDSGNSGFRYTSSDMSWRLNWQTPSRAGWYEVVITPPGTDLGSFCTRLR